MRRISFIFLILGLGIRLWIAWRPLAIIDNLLFPDDTYISLAIARNIALGHGMTFDRLGVTNGFQPLYVFLLVPLFQAIPNDLSLPIHIALSIQAILSTGTAYLLARLVSHIVNRLAGFFALTLWLFAPAAIHQGINGLETGVALFFVALAFALHFGALMPGLPPIRRLVLVGFIVGLAVFTRIDNIILIPLLMGDLLWQQKQKGNRAAGLQQAIILGFFAFLILAPWLLVSYQCCGSFIPESGKAVRFQALASFHDIPGQTATLWVYNGILTLRILAEIPLQLDHPIAWSLAAGCLVLGLWVNHKRESGWYAPLKNLAHMPWLRRLWPVWAYALGLLAVYNIYVMAYWFFVRYFYAVAWVLTILIAAALAGMAHEVSRRGRSLPSPLQTALLPLSLRQATAVITFILLLWFLPGLHRFMFVSPAQGGYYNIARWANAQFPEAVVIGSAQSGALTYFAHPNMTVINMDGVANPDAFAALQAGQQFDYLRQVNLEYIINWPINTDLLRDYGGEPLAGALKEMGAVEGVETLNQTWYWYQLLPPPESAPDE